MNLDSIGKTVLKNEGLINKGNEMRLKAIDLAKLGKFEEAKKIVADMPDTIDKQSALGDIDFWIDKLKEGK